MLRSLLLVTAAALGGGCASHYYVTDVFQHDGVVFVRRCHTNSNNFSGSECWFERAPELPPGAVIEQPYAPTQGAPPPSAPPAGGPPSTTPPLATR
jgi:hypothetical protein